jgi:hypothetical protein
MARALAPSGRVTQQWSQAAKKVIDVPAGSGYTAVSSTMDTTPRGWLLDGARVAPSVAAGGWYFYFRYPV